MVMGMIALAAVFCFSSCSQSPEEKAKELTEQMIEAAKKGDTETLKTLTKDIEEYSKSLSEEDKAKFDAASEKAMEEAMAKLSDSEKMTVFFAIMSAGVDQAGDAIGEAADEVDAAADEVDAAVDEANAELEGAAKDVEEVANAVEDVANAAKSVDNALKALK